MPPLSGRAFLAAMVLFAAAAPGRADVWDDPQPGKATGFPAGVPAPSAPFASSAAPAEGFSVVADFDLSRLVEKEHLGPEKHAALLAIGGFDPKREPLVLIHGIFGSPADLQPVVDRLRGDRYQIFVLAYADFTRKTSLNGLDFAEELSALSRRLGPGRPMTIAAHSMGGIVTRAALNSLAKSGEGKAWSRIRAVCVDTPWHGFPGPGGEMTLPGAFDDMRAKSAMYADGLLSTPVADNVEIELVFAQEGTAAFDYTEGPIAALPAKLANYYSTDAPVSGDLRLVNFWKALIWSSGYGGLQQELRAAAEKGPLSEQFVKDALLRRYPRFPGDHTGVLSAKGPGSLLEHLAAELKP